MALPRISVAGMMGLLLGMALFLASVRYPTDATAAAVLLVTQASLGFSILAVIYRDGAARAFWLGFALMGWGYMAFNWEPWVRRGIPDLGLVDAWLPGMPPSGTVDHRNRFHLAKLEEPVSMSFANEAPFEDVLKYIKAATTGPNDTGLQIYVDPIALNDAEKTMHSPVTIDVEGSPLRATLGLMVKQLGLGYVVEDGMVKIGNVPTASGSTPLRRMGHCYSVLLAAFFGAVAARALHKSRTNV